MSIDLPANQWLKPIILIMAITVLEGCSKLKHGDVVKEDTPIAEATVLEPPRSEVPQPPENKVPDVRPAGLPGASALPQGPSSKSPTHIPAPPPNKTPEPPVPSHE